jgi:hypothetical protein
MLESPTPITQVTHGTQALIHQLYVLYVNLRFISAADKAGGGVRKRVRKRDRYVYPEISHMCENFFPTLQACENV